VFVYWKFVQVVVNEGSVHYRVCVLEIGVWFCKCRECVLEIGVYGCKCNECAL